MVVSSEEKEILDIVGENDEVVGSKDRDEIYSQKIKDYRVVNAFIKNAEGKLWMPTRVATKKIFPSSADFSVGGHVESGETYEQSLVRETREEVNINLSEVEFKEIGYFSPHQSGVSSWMKVYEIYTNEAPNYNEDDYSGFEWLTPEEIMNRFEAGEAMKSDIPEVIKLCYLS